MKAEISPESYNGTGVAPAARERLKDDLRALAQDASVLLNDLSEAGTSSAQSIRQTAFEKARAAQERSRVYVNEHPWQAVAAAAGAGLALGWLLGRRSS